jgi:hypothetical protein
VASKFFDVIRERPAESLEAYKITNLSPSDREELAWAVTAGMTGRSAETRATRSVFREALEDERVRLIGQLGDQREVITTEAIGIVILVSLVHIGPGEGDAVEFLLAFILPHGGFNAAEAEGLYRKVRGGSGVFVLSRRLSVFVRHI